MLGNLATRTFSTAVQHSRVAVIGAGCGGQNLVAHLAKTGKFAANEITVFDPATDSTPNAWISGSIAAFMRCCASAVLPNSCPSRPLVESDPIEPMICLRVLFHAVPMDPRPMRVSVDHDVAAFFLSFQ